jgi:hypothetical protein
MLLLMLLPSADVMLLMLMLMLLLMLLTLLLPLLPLLLLPLLLLYYRLCHCLCYRSCYSCCLLLPAAVLPWRWHYRIYLCPRCAQAVSPRTIWWSGELVVGGVGGGWGSLQRYER